MNLFATLGWLQGYFFIVILANNNNSDISSRTVYTKVDVYRWFRHNICRLKWCIHSDYYTRFYLSNHSPSKIAYVQPLVLRNQRGLHFFLAISWIGSLQLALPFSLGIVSGKLFDAGYFHAVQLSGSCLYVVSWVQKRTCLYDICTHRRPNQVIPPIAGETPKICPGFP